MGVVSVEDSPPTVRAALGDGYLTLFGQQWPVWVGGVLFGLVTALGYSVFLLAFRQNATAAGFVVQCSPDAASKSRAHVALIADHFVVVGDSLAAKLNSRVVAGARQLGFQLQFEVAEFSLRTEKLIVRNPFFQAAGSDGLVCHAEDVGVALPALERLAVKQWLEVGGKGGGGQCRGTAFDAGCGSGRRQC